MKEFGIQEKLSSESVLAIEYCYAASISKPQITYTSPDWISRLRIHDQFGLISACYDGLLRRFVSPYDKPVSQRLGHSGSIKDFSFFPQSDDSKVLLVSGGTDLKARAWELSEAGFEQTAVFTGHKDSIQALSAFPESASSLRFISASWDGEILIWSSSSGAAPTVSKKRRVQVEDEVKQESPLLEIDEPVARLHEHSGSVSSLVWPHPLAFYSAGWDDKLIHWDAQRGEVVSCWSSGQTTAFLCLDYSLSANLFVSGHSDASVRTWDPRTTSRARTGAISTFKSHAKWVNDVCWFKGEGKFVSCSTDQTVKLWDLRSNIPLATMNLREGVWPLSVTVDRDETIFCGSSDSSLQVFRSESSIRQ